VNPDFEVADETETARFVTEALDLTLRAARALLADDERFAPALRARQAADLAARAR
jgi:hypothetical protein